MLSMKKRNYERKESSTPYLSTIGFYVVSIVSPHP